ncbi:MAG: hypothetical protein ABUS79_07825 [Pseudomonadota bacterium]
MAKTPSIHGKQERLEADGQTHRRDCECARCEAGFTPTEHDRDLAAKRIAGKQGRRAAERAAERKKETARLRQLELTAYFRAGNATADAEVERWRALRARAVGDRRMDEFLQLRRTGWSVEGALAEVDRRLPPGAWTGADNDNADDRRQSDNGVAPKTGLLFP